MTSAITGTTYSLRGICDALEKMARDGLVIRVVNENGCKDEKESNHKEG